MKKILKWAGAAVVILVILLVVFGKKPERTNDNSAPVVTANFVDLKAIAAITKFRSCQGHLVVPQDGRETKRNMKHYFYLKKDYKTAPGMVPLYAPFDGYIASIFSDTKLGEGRSSKSADLSISSQKGLLSRNSWNFTFLHIEVKDGLKKGDKVSAGDLVGNVALDIPPYYSFDVVYAKMATFPKKIDNWRSPYADLDSVFNHMTDKVFEEYKVFGISSKDDLIIGKDARDAAPCKYEGSGPRFDPSGNENQRENDMIGDIDK